MEVVKKEVNNNFFVKHEKSNSEFYLSLVNYLNPAYAIPNLTFKKLLMHILIP